jgi:hypothetical protein
MLHGNCGIFKMLDLPLRCISARIVRMKNHESQKHNHDQHIKNNNSAPTYPKASLQLPWEYLFAQFKSGNKAKEYRPTTL